MKQSLEPVAKKQQKRKDKFRHIDEDYFGPKHSIRNEYKRKVKHRNLKDWDTDI